MATKDSTRAANLQLPCGGTETNNNNSLFAGFPLFSFLRLVPPPSTPAPTVSVNVNAKRTVQSPRKRDDPLWQGLSSENIGLCQDSSSLAPVALSSSSAEAVRTTHGFLQYFLTPSWNSKGASVGSYSHHKTTPTEEQSILPRVNPPLPRVLPNSTNPWYRMTIPILRCNVTPVRSPMTFNVCYKGGQYPSATKPKPPDSRANSRGVCP